MCYSTAWLPVLTPTLGAAEKTGRSVRGCRRGWESPLCCPQHLLAHHELSSRLLNNHLSQRGRRWFLTWAVIHSCLATLPELPLLGALGVASTDFLYVQGMYPGTGHLGQVTVGHPPHPYGPQQLQAWQAVPRATEKPEVDFRAGETPKNIHESCPGLALTGRPPLPRTSKETNQSVH